MYAAVGLVLFFVWAAVNRGLASVHRGLALALLSPTPGSLRVRELERTRGRSVQDADATLRRIERDLHDGTQARLVAIAMQLGDVRDQLATADVGDDLRRQVDGAHEATKETLTELEKNVSSIFAKLDLPVDAGDHRRVLAVLRLLQA